ncbi:hypothetical protein FOCC_FOCC017514 [Frankliniella occidentalis]|nr:hypothetical protein FOCC_FOCC017514 [Frankliniella occidentalis]
MTCGRGFRYSPLWLLLVLELDRPVDELVAGQHCGVHCRAVRHGLVRVDGLAELLAAEHVPEQRAHLGDAGDRRVLLNDGVKPLPNDDDAQGERCHVLEGDSLVEELVAGQHGSVHRRAVRHGLVRVDGLAELLAAEHVPEQRAHLGNAGGATHQHHLLHLSARHLRKSQASPT